MQNRITIQKYFPMKSYSCTIACFYHILCSMLICSMLSTATAMTHLISATSVIQPWIQFRTIYYYWGHRCSMAIVILVFGYKNNVSAVGTEKFQNMLKNIYEIYQLMSFRCIMSLSYRVTFLCNVLEQTHYTSESPVRYFFMKKL